MASLRDKVIDHEAMVSRAAVIVAVEQIDAFPGMGRPGRVQGTKELVVAGTHDIVPYRKKGWRSEILRVYHTARLWPETF